MSKTHIVVVEDDLPLADMVSLFLESEGFRVTRSEDGESAVDVVREEQPDLVLLDMMLPGIDGLEVCRRIRAFYTGSIIMLTAREEELIEISALNTGADDYIVKPVRPHILKARILAQLRRQSMPPVMPASGNRIDINGLRLDPDSYQITLNEQPLELTDAEFELLLMLVRHAGEVISRDMLFSALKGNEYDGEDRSIDMRISSLRKKLNDDQPPYRLIKTIRSKGYLFLKDSVC